MMNCEERYEYVIKRRGEIIAKRRKRRAAAAKIAVPVCGIAVVSGAVGAAARYRSAEVSERVSQADSGYSAESVWATDNAQSVVSAEVSERVSQVNSGNAAESVGAPYSAQPVSSNVLENSVSNTLNIGEVEVSQGGGYNFFCIPGFYEKTREETLEHFGLSPDLSLSGVIEDFKEVPPLDNVFNPEGKHGFRRWERFAGDTEGELDERYDFQIFRFENSDGSKWADAVFCHNEFVPWWINGGIDRRQTEKLPTSIIRGVEMLIGERNIGGYYAEFNAPNLSVGLTTGGCSVEETEAVLDYLSWYVGAGGASDENSTSVGSVSIFYGDVNDVIF